MIFRNFFLILSFVLVKIEGRNTDTAVIKWEKSS